MCYSIFRLKLWAYLSLALSVHAFTPSTHSSTVGTAHFLPVTRSPPRRFFQLRSSTGEDSWVEALRNAKGKDVKRDLWSTGSENEDPSRRANRLLLDWLQKNDVYVSEASSWGEAPHPLGLSTETYDENNDNEASGRGLIARKVWQPQALSGPNAYAI